MADGEKYEVTDRYRVALGKTTVIVVGKDDMPHILPLLTMTGISYLKSSRGWLKAFALARFTQTNP
jgi:hypothetical protein